MSLSETPLARPLIFGEVLLDRFPGGRCVIGGAPFNVAWHLQGFGLKPLLVTRIGEDVPGEWILRAMRGWGMDTAGVQIDPDHPTGGAQVRLTDGEPSFRVLADQAYDHVAVEPAMALLQPGRWSVVYHGTLAVRGAANRAVLKALRARIDAPVFVDANLRDPWWAMEPVQDLLIGVRWLKLNRSELLELSGTVMVDEPTIAAAARELRRRYGFDWVIVTDGAAGAQFYVGERSGRQAALATAPIVSAVGAGDGFSAVCLLGLIENWPLETTLARASEFAARICMEVGATSSDAALYAHFRNEWRR